MYDVRVYPVYPVVMGMRPIHSIGYTFPEPTGAAHCSMPIAVGFTASFSGRAATSKASGDHPNWTQRDEDEAHSMLYKTELCRSYQETGTCNYGPKCQVTAQASAARRGVLPLAQSHHHSSYMRNRFSGARCMAQRVEQSYCRDGRSGTGPCVDARVYECNWALPTLHCWSKCRFTWP